MTKSLICIDSRFDQVSSCLSPIRGKQHRPAIAQELQLESTWMSRLCMACLTSAWHSKGVVDIKGPTYIADSNEVCECPIVLSGG